MRRRFRSNLVYPMYTSHQESALIIELSNMERDENRPEIWLPLKTSIAISIASRDFIFVYWWIFVDITLLQARDHCIIINCYFFFYFTLHDAMDRLQPKKKSFFFSFLIIITFHRELIIKHRKHNVERQKSLALSFSLEICFLKRFDWMSQRCR